MTASSHISADRSRTAIESLFDREEIGHDPLNRSEPHRPGFVLEAIENTDVLRDEPVILYCPGCGDSIATYATGLPAVVCHFSEHCKTCDVELDRWSVVALPASHAEYISPTEFAELTWSYWQKNLWTGIKTAEECPRTREFCRLYDEMAAAFEWEWRDTCPLCRRTLGELGRSYLSYHHWLRSPDVGICICWGCHDAISAFERDTDLDWRAISSGFRNKHDLQLPRLAARELAFVEHSSLASLIHTVSERYNVPHTDENLAAILTEALGSAELREKVLDETVWHDLP